MGSNGDSMEIMWDTAIRGHTQVPFGDDLMTHKDGKFGDGLWHWVYHINGDSS
jgi:hypothetical protein